MGYVGGTPYQILLFKNDFPFFILYITLSPLFFFLGKKRSRGYRGGLGKLIIYRKKNLKKVKKKGI